jgi:hypothetical protein
MPPKAKLSKNAASVKPKSRKLLKIKGGMSKIKIQIVCDYYDKIPSIGSNIKSLEYSNLYYKDDKGEPYYLPTSRNMINFLFASDNNTRYQIQEKLLNEQNPFYSAGWSRAVEPFINTNHFGIVCYYTLTIPNKQYSRTIIILLVRDKNKDSILRCFKLINKSMISRAFALFQKKSDEDSDYS